MEVPFYRKLVFVNGSLFVNIPAAVVKFYHLERGQPVEISSTLGKKGVELTCLILKK